MSALSGSCHCGAARITVPRRPETVTECNCSLCAKTGFRGIYFPADELAIEGDFDPYVRADLAQAYMTNWRCRTCGILTHWTLIDGAPDARTGVNARLFAGAFDDLPIELVDGASWDD